MASFVEGADELATRLMLEREIAQAKAKVAVVRGAHTVAVNMANNVAKDTGFTAASMTSDPTPQAGDGGVFAEAGPTWMVGRYLEYGTIFMAPRPYMDRSSDPEILTRELNDIGDI